MAEMTTPRPWRMENTAYESADIWGADDKRVGYVSSLYYSGKHDVARANAELIVRAVNSHDALVEALEEMYAAWDGYEMLAALDFNIQDKVKAALEAAKGE